MGKTALPIEQVGIKIYFNEIIEKRLRKPYATAEITGRNGHSLTANKILPKPLQKEKPESAEFISYFAFQHATLGRAVFSEQYGLRILLIPNTLSPNQIYDLITDLIELKQQGCIIDGFIRLKPELPLGEMFNDEYEYINLQNCDKSDIETYSDDIIEDVIIELRELLEQYTIQNNMMLQKTQVN